MAFPSSSGQRALSLERAWSGATATAGKVKWLAQQLRAASAAGPVKSSQLIEFVGQLATNRALLASFAAVPGIGAYAQEQLGDPTLNVATEFAAMQNAIGAVKDWMIANFPKDASGYLLATQFDANGLVVERTFSTASLAALRVELDALIATID